VASSSTKTAHSFSMISAAPSMAFSVDAGERVDRDLRHLLRRGVRDLLDVHAAGGRADRQEGTVRAIEQEGEVVLLGDRARLLDQDLVDRVALDVHAEDLSGLPVGVVGILGHLDTARLAPAAGLDLGLHHDPPGQLRGRGTCLLRGVRDLSARHRDAVLREELLRLMFEQVHEGPSLLSG
jgi:hypothetical protein